jgi:hypothetical protein
MLTFLTPTSFYYCKIKLQAYTTLADVWLSLCMSFGFHSSKDLQNNFASNLLTLNVYVSDEYYSRNALR